MIKNKQYFISFWVGLIDGDGSIQVNHWRKKYIQFRIVIKMKYTDANVEILELLCQHLDFGQISFVTQKGYKYVIWVENRQSKIEKVFWVFQNYAPLSSRLQCQLVFFKRHLQTKNVQNYLQTRSLKYEKQALVQQKLQLLNVHTLHYFPGWFSGFIEAEGCFTARLKSSLVVSFSIAQKNDLYLLESIKLFLGAQNNVRFIAKENLYLLEVYRRSVLTLLHNHFKSYPLLGQKKHQYDRIQNQLILKNFVHSMDGLCVMLSYGCGVFKKYTPVS